MAIRTTPAPRTAHALAALICLSLPTHAAFAQDRAPPSPSIQHVGASTSTDGSSAESCAADFHERLAAIEETQLVAYRDAETSIGAVDVSLPGRLLFAASERPGLEAGAQRAIEMGETLARRQGRTSFARDANTRWIAGRIREDLTDFLTQKPTPYLCAGTDNYLEVLRSYAAQGAPSPSQLDESLDAHRRTAMISLDAAFAAMRPAPLPRFAPAHRPGMLSIDGLRMALQDELREREPTRVADRGGASRISESRIDPALPPIGQNAANRLQTPADISRAVTALLRTAKRRGFIAEAGPGPGIGEKAGRPNLARLAALRSHFSGHSGRIADPLVRPSIERALSDLEILDYLQAAVHGTADPLSSAMHATMDAIETAHSDACTCAD